MNEIIFLENNMYISRGGGLSLSEFVLEMHVYNYQRILQPLIYYFYFCFDPETFKLSFERDYFWEVCRDVW